jgi:hypothetical protein
MFRLAYVPAYLYVYSFFLFLLECRRRHRHRCCPPPVQVEHLSFSFHSAFSGHVQASHVMHFYMCVADSVSIFLLCVFLFYSVSYFPSQGPIFTAGKIFPAFPTGEQGGGGVYCSLPPPPEDEGINSQNLKRQTHEIVCLMLFNMC